MSLLAQSQQWYPTHVKVVVIRARGLRSKGKDGTNDAYAIMQLGKEQYSSSVAEKTAAPQWREEAEFELPPLQSGRGEKSTLRLTVMHRALVGLDKFLGQAAISLSELYGNKTRSKVGWYKLYSKAGKADKERGEIEADIQFVRNNMTASMFDLSATDKSRSTLGKLKDRLKGKKRGGFSDSASAIVPSLGMVADSDGEDELPTSKAATTSRLKKLFPKSNLQRSSLSQSMSVIPTAPSSPPGGIRDSQGFTEIKLHDSAGEETSPKGLHVPKILSHKRAASADNKQLDLVLPGNARKEPLSLFGGLRPKSDPVSQSNLCINGSHVYTEEPAPAVTPSRPRPEPRSHFYAPSPEEGSRPDSPSPRGAADPPAPGSGKGAPDAGDEGRARSLNPFEAEEEEEEKRGQTAEQEGGQELAPEEPKPQAKKEEARRGGLMSLFPKKAEAPRAPEGKDPHGLSEEGRGEVKKPTSTSVWASRTAAVKPKLEVSPKAETGAGTWSPSPPPLSAQAHPFDPTPPMGSRIPSSPGLGPLVLQDVPSLRSPSSDSRTTVWASPLPPLPNSSSSSSSSSPHTSEASINLKRQRAPYREGNRMPAEDLFWELTHGSTGAGGGQGSPGSPRMMGEGSEGGETRPPSQDPRLTGTPEPWASLRPDSSPLSPGGAVTTTSSSPGSPVSTTSLFPSPQSPGDTVSPSLPSLGGVVSSSPPSLGGAVSPSSPSPGSPVSTTSLFPSPQSPGDTVSPSLSSPGGAVSSSPPSLGGSVVTTSPSPGGAVSPSLPSPGGAVSPSLPSLVSAVSPSLPSPGGAVSSALREPPAVPPRGGTPTPGLPVPVPRGAARVDPPPSPEGQPGSAPPPRGRAPGCENAEHPIPETTGWKENEEVPPDTPELPRAPPALPEEPLARNGDPSHTDKMAAGPAGVVGWQGGLAEGAAAPEQPLTQPTPADPRWEQSPSPVALAPSLLPAPHAPSPPALSLLLSPSPPLLSPSSSPTISAARSANPPEPGLSDRKRLPQAKVLPTETQPIDSLNSESAVPSSRRPHPVKPMTNAEPKLHNVSSEETLKTRFKVVDAIMTKPSGRAAVTLSERLTCPKDYDPSDPAAAYAQLTHDELIQLVLKQKETISRKDSHVQELESYIDNLLVRVMEETPNILRVSYQPARKAERV
ncbi:rab11 family-interacting protein 1-like [Hemiscyllium ocellatum]|uniref:rab11 family-interacting protein 1-like n=1 Tax=Hemiscyllium ocellatum TaxID=170820 RepID=UPI0029668310|nr:rab11 family-interacting protein 1-like [Hemiscyllium ocellatum]